MLFVEGNKIKKYFNDRLVLDIDNLKIYSEDRIGIVGVNGVGKTTLINILSQKLEADEGWVKIYGKFAYISQLEEVEKKKISSEMASKFGIPNTWRKEMSGGEKTRFKIAQALEEKSMLIFADEPTSNLDIEGIELMEMRFKEYKGGLVIISHDRDFLDKLCNKILEIEDGRIKIYHGNYSDYAEQKSHERKRSEFEYQQYVKEKKRLQEVIKETKEKVRGIRKTPRRMGNSEARLHKMGSQKAKANLEKAIKSAEKRIEHLEVKEKPKSQKTIQLDVMESDKLHSRIIIEGKNINKSFGNKVIFNNADFTIYNAAKVALIGPNGCGKSTLIKMILDGDEGIRIPHGAKIGYFSQNMEILEENASILENVMEDSLYTETFVRIFLARLLFKGEDVYKKVSVLSGGERVKVSFAKILLKDINLLILDEPTNYMDINSLEVIEETLRDFDRTLLFVSHDRRLISGVADHIMTIENQEIKMFHGNYQQYLASKKKSLAADEMEIKKEIFVLENKISEIIGRLSMPSPKEDVAVLDQEYYETLRKLKELKERL